MKIAIGTDHAGVELKAELVKVLEAHGAEVLDQGPFSSDSVDYPDYGHKVASLVSEGTCSLGGGNTFSGFVGHGGSGIVILRYKFQN